MRALKIGLIATAAICALSATAQADCVKVGSVGEAPTHAIAELFAKNGLKNVIYGQGREGKGPVHLKCDDSGATSTCRASQTACSGGTPATCLGAWLCLPM